MKKALSVCMVIIMFAAVILLAPAFFASSDVGLNPTDETTADEARDEYNGDAAVVAKGHRSAFLVKDMPAQKHLSETGGSDIISARIRGSYYVNIQKALDRINEIRYEACQEGIENPAASGKKLTPNDYHPLVWSSSLESTARKRAAEGLVCMSHTRPNGKSCFSVDGAVESFSEVLHWNNYSTDMVTGINSFYKEKTYWVNKTDGVTGHYTAMINPKYYSVGLGVFYSDYSDIYTSCLCGRFSTQSSGVDHTFGSAKKNTVATVEVNCGNISGTSLEIVSDVPDKLTPGDTVSYELFIKTDYNGHYARLSLKDNVTWSSSDKSVFTVSSGTVTAVSGGSAKLSAKSSDGYSASITVTVEDDRYLSSALLGDVDGDSAVTITDAALIQRYVAGIPIPFDIIVQIADTDGDGSVTLYDAALIQKWLTDTDSGKKIGQKLK